ncbi:FlgO family outer membrane protein [Pseudoalteromonas xiamenensis]|uniref:FlgO family outer membrane protein n=1 Tax=Pseudoalteromonas xiamenensis TaxID=882626 RepID=UPI0027E46143|nr:FlgO family outer membrane protein [Pseudoalteromonas xiamenensis]WMN59353.1 FlgO family outer membrane protein [Pseudoalteromonas xiamenensis]
MKKLLVALILPSLTGCLSTIVNIDNQPQSTTPSVMTMQPTVVDNAEMPIAADMEGDSLEEAREQYVFSPSKHHKQLNDYVEQLALSLSDSLMVSETPTIAVSSFVELNHSLQSTNQLGNQLSEGLLQALQRFGFVTIDFKVMDNIKVAGEGDFSFSRSLDELNKNLSADHVLSGSLIYRQQGVEIQARVVNLKSKALAASARTVVPYYVLQDIHL